MTLVFRIKSFFATPERTITTLLGLFWLIDGVLQLQTAMFSPKFITAVLAPNLAHQPAIIQSVISFGITLFKINMLLEDMLFAGVQIIIGIVLLSPFSEKVQRIALWISIVWALIIWIFGEGFGDIFTGSVSFYTGAPGAAILYIFIAIFLLFPQKLSFVYFPKVLGVVFISGGIVNAFPLFWTREMQSIPYQLSISDSNGLIAFPANVLSHIVLSPIVSNGVGVGILLILGSLLFFKPTRLIGYITLVFLFLVWLISQDLGGIFTFPNGTATDPNSAPLFMLFLLPLFFGRKNQQTS